MEDLYTVKEAAAKLKVSDRAVLDWLRAGKLHGLRAGKAWRIKESDLEAFLHEPRESDEAPKPRRKPAAPARAKRQR
jgi:excisionase family DNA binding protein